MLCASCNVKDDLLRREFCPARLSNQKHIKGGMSEQQQDQLRKGKETLSKSEVLHVF